MRVKLLTDLQIFGCELHQNAFGDRSVSAFLHVMNDVYLHQFCLIKYR